MSSDQIDMIINNSEWDEEKREWKVPYFTYREKNVNLPKLMSKEMTREMVETEKEKKELFFRNSKRDNETSNKRGSPDDGFKLNNIVENARRVNEYESNNTGSRTTNVINRAHLTPLKNESYEKARGNLMMADDKRKRSTNERLDPIPIGGDSRKYLWKGEI